MRKRRPYLEPTECSAEEEPRLNFRLIPRERKIFDELRQAAKVAPIER